MSQNLYVREIEKDEMDLFKELRLSALMEAAFAFEDTYESIFLKPKSYWNELFEAFMPPNNHKMFILMDSGQAVGSIYTFKCSDVHASFGGLWVSQFFQRKGGATILIKRVMEWAGKMGLELIRIWNFESNQKAESLYEKIGFKKTGVSKDLKDGRRIIQLIYPIKKRP